VGEVTAVRSWTDGLVGNLVRAHGRAAATLAAACLVGGLAACVADARYGPWLVGGAAGLAWRLGRWSR
jgi:hypothetical protein